MISMKENTNYRITCDFVLDDANYIAWVLPYYELSDEELVQLPITRYSYIAHLFSLEGFKTFELFQDDKGDWRTPASPLFIDAKVVYVLNYVMGRLLK